MTNNSNPMANQISFSPAVSLPAAMQFPPPVSAVPLELDDTRSKLVSSTVEKLRNNPNTDYLSDINQSVPQFGPTAVDASPGMKILLIKLTL